MNFSSTLFQRLQIHKNSQSTITFTHTEHTVRLVICFETKEEMGGKGRREGKSDDSEYVFVCIWIYMELLLNDILVAVHVLVIAED